MIQLIRLILRRLAVIIEAVRSTDGRCPLPSSDPRTHASPIGKHIKAVRGRPTNLLMCLRVSRVERSVALAELTTNQTLDGRCMRKLAPPLVECRVSHSREGYM